jgi:hypothetical protein
VTYTVILINYILWAHLKTAFFIIITMKKSGFYSESSQKETSIKGFKKFPYENDKLSLFISYSQFLKKWNLNHPNHTIWFGKANDGAQLFVWRNDGFNNPWFFQRLFNYVSCWKCLLFILDTIHQKKFEGWSARKGLYVDTVDNFVDKVTIFIKLWFFYCIFCPYF